MATIKKISDSQNFGEWMEKINELIDNTNEVNVNLEDTQNIVNSAVSSGLIGNTTSSNNNLGNYNNYVNYGVYYVNTNTNAPKNDVATHLYVAKNEIGDITQIAITIENNTEIFVRSKKFGDKFTKWSRTLTEDIANTLYLSLNGDVVNGTINGNISVSENTTLNNLTVNGITSLKDKLIIGSNNKAVISNDGSYLTINANTENPIQYFIQNDDSVTTDVEGKNVKYYIDRNTNTLFSYNRHLKLKIRNPEVYNVDADGNELSSIAYYIQQNNDVSVEESGINPSYYINGNKVYTFKDNKLSYYFIDDKFFDYRVAYTITNDVLRDDLGNEVLYIEDSEFVRYIPKLYFVYKPDVLHIPSFVTDIDPTGKNFEDLAPKYYFNDDMSISTDIEGKNVIWTISGNKLIPYGDNEGVFPEYYIRENGKTICYREIWYNVEDDVATRVDGISQPLKLFINEDKVISLNDIPTYSVKRFKDEVVNENGIVQYYVQRDKHPILLTTDEAGERLNYYWQGDTVTKDYVGTEIVYYYKDGYFSTKNVVYYIQKDNSITTKPIKTDTNVVYYIESGNKIVSKRSAINIDLNKNICYINGSSLNASYLTSEGLTDSYKGEENNLAASGLAVSNLHNYNEYTYMPYVGGTFTGEVVHNNDIILGVKSSQTEERCKIQSYGELLFHCLENTSIVANSTACELYLDRKNESVYGEENRPCVIGGRTRSGTSELQVGQPVYALGCVEFYEDKTTLRHRKINLGNIVNEETNVAVILEKTEDKTSFRPSVDRAVSLGTGAMRYDQVFCVSGEISTSDKNLKTKISKIDDSLLDKWEKVEWKSFKLKDSVDKKSSEARTHTGLIAQDVEKTLKGVDISKYGFFCKDSWNDVYDTQYITNSEGKCEEIKTLVKPAGEQYSIRYQEAQAIENAYLRRKINSLEKQIEELKSLIQK